MTRSHIQGRKAVVTFLTTKCRIVNECGSHLGRHLLMIEVGDLSGSGRHLLSSFLGETLTTIT